jgi:hypothetical protein
MDVKLNGELPILLLRVSSLRELLLSRVNAGRVKAPSLEIADE